MEIDEVAARLDAAATRLHDPHARVALLDPGRVAFGADAPGEIGALGRALAGQLADALSARDREATRAGVAAAHLATALRDSAAGYYATEAGARDRVGGL